MVSKDAMTCAQQLRLSTLNPNVVKAHYSVRGRLSARADELKVELAHPNNKLPFEHIVALNLGNPQFLRQKPVTFIRQVLALVELPELMEQAKSLFPGDVVRRARRLLDEIVSVGAYGPSLGIRSVREEVANFIGRRDGFPSNPDHIHLLTGASSGVHRIFKLLSAQPNDGIMIPIPQYPLYSAAAALYHLEPVRYYLNESKEWSVTLNELLRAYEEATARNVRVRAICVINPGNPSGNILHPDFMREILRFCKDKRLVLVADEVYQTNIFYDDTDDGWVSFKKVLRELQEAEPGNQWNNLELFSLQSVSKGQLGECGHRGGYFELTNISSDVHQQLTKLASIDLCPPMSGQICVSALVNPPQQGDPSYEQYIKEIANINKTLHQRAKMLHDAFEEMKGVTCNMAKGALYLFPRIRFPQQFIDKAKSQEISPDELYCLRLLETTGICIVPGEGFGQKEGEFHIRTTFLAGGLDFILRWKEFHQKLFKTYK